VEWGYPNSTGYLNPVGYGFEVLVFILVENWDGFGIPELYRFEFRRKKYVPALPHCLAMLIHRTSD
jgi:hypothetical protein